ncbi:DUF3077 domain-containing protein [Candidatus Methylospira mobilis]|uniref:DUF3077 domain-containing protein n=1 Tax=Candidatus Methylospira mobilis TaxID=1808979 RepID=A0A5Q0BRD5_9GAMM|nr:DUF3077 domain-containing protein [Candidatus Methylospira mobilis]QFY44637.1 DUF3077 domain-containing protein [Candidatus Methylospira mobilis]
MAKPNTTEATPFFSCNADGAKLFAVQPGIPVEDAMNQLACLLDTALNTVRYSNPTDPEEQGKAHALQCLLEMSTGLLESVMGVQS